MTGRARYLLSAILAAVAFSVVSATVFALQEEGFPHEDHEGLFPVCSGCHAGVASGNEATMYPAAETCARCHDGVEEDRVSWREASIEASNVSFDHVEHAAELQAEGDPVQSCESCHSGPSDRMAVDDAAELGTCWGCHAHETPSHYEGPGATCEVCHIPVAETRFDRVRLEALPIPADHDDPLFLPENHGLVAGDTPRCATCHTVERCATCHVDAGRPEIEAMPAGSALDLPPASAAYPVPDSHVDEGWFSAHGEQAPVRDCSTCHTTDDCRSCHIGELPELAAALPQRGSVPAPGVHLVRQAPENHVSPFFLDAHENLAVTQQSTCATCHTEAQCVECHDGPVGGGYHEADFVSRHSGVAFGREDECASCHNPAAFCRECHTQGGLGSVGRLDAGFHDAEPLWLLRHGQAARQGLESCASCHQQNDCVQCHGVLGAFKVSPHTRDFDARAAYARNPRSCMACHVGNPIGGGGP